MNCAESQDLLVDLAYGELTPARAAEVEEHVAGCPACRAERSYLAEARKLAAPLCESEEPSANFDEPILRAARAEAGMQADGTPGQVVEVTATVKPLGLQAARLDPHARVRGDAPRVAWWRRRTAIIGSMAAAAAALAVVVSFSLRPPSGRVAPVEVEPITVRAPGSVVPDAMKDAIARNDEREPPATPPAPTPPAAQLRKTELATPERKAAPAQDAARPAPAAKLAARDGKADLAKEAVKSGAKASEEQKVKVAERDRAAAANRRVAAPEESSGVPVSFGEAAAPAAPAAVGSVASVSGGQVDQYAPPPPRAAAKGVQGRSAEALENDASTARRGGDYARAAALYREAADLRKDSAPQQAAWNLAHAVECLAAGGNIAEAVAVRSDLLRSFPDQQGARAAANSALRFVPLPGAEDAGN